MRPILPWPGRASPHHGSPCLIGNPMTWQNLRRRGVSGPRRRGCFPCCYPLRSLCCPICPVWARRSDDKWPPARPAGHNGDLTAGHRGATSDQDIAPAQDTTPGVDTTPGQDIVPGQETAPGPETASGRETAPAPPVAPSAAHAGPGRSRPAWNPAMLRRHWLIAVLLAAGLVLRIL